MGASGGDLGKDEGALLGGGGAAAAQVGGDGGGAVGKVFPALIAAVEAAGGIDGLLRLRGLIDAEIVLRAAGVFRTYEVEDGRMFLTASVEVAP